MMSTLLRYLKDPITHDLKDKMVFLGGPRQVGKTTFSQSLIPNYHEGHPAYLNWDSPVHRKIITAGTWPRNEKLIIFDEIHKFAKWRNLIKGYFDTLKGAHKFLVTGSARLDYYRKGGDSLLGRYFYFRMHPLSLPEIGKKADLSNLLKYGGFPEPYIKQDETFLKRWHLQRRERIIYSDIRDLERIREISLIELLVEALPDRVGSPLSRKNLAQDLDVDFKTVENWLTILENVYYCFRVSPYGQPRIRAVKKEQKLYLWDWSELDQEGARWENFVASHLLKFCHYRQDTRGDKMELRFLRDVDRREIDFVVLKDKKPIFAVECKSGEKSASPNLKYFSERTTIPRFYQVHRGKKSYSTAANIRVLPFSEFCDVEGLV